MIDLAIQFLPFSFSTFLQFYVMSTNCLQQAALNKAENEKEENSSVENASQSSDYVDAVASELNKLAVSVNSNRVTTPANSEESPNPDIDKRIRALKKKVRFLMLLVFLLVT